MDVDDKQLSVRDQMQMLVRVAPATVETAFRVLSWAGHVQNGAYLQDGTESISPRKLTPLEAPVYNAALERLQAYLTDRVPENVVVVVPDEQAEVPSPEDLNKLMEDLNTKTPPGGSPYGHC